MPEFFLTPAGLALSGIIIAVVSLLIIEINYRFFTKTVLDFIFAFSVFVVCLPVMAVLSPVFKRKYGKVIEREPYLGLNGKIIYLHSFACKCKAVRNLPRITDILCGRLSFVGVKPLEVADGAVIDDENLGRFSARPGLICHLALSGNSLLTYGEMFALDERYARRRGLFKDILIVIKYFVCLLRGEGKSYMGEAANQSYVQSLVSDGKLTSADAEKAFAYAEEALEEDRKIAEFNRSRYNLR